MGAKDQSKRVHPRPRVGETEQPERPEERLRNGFQADVLVS